MLITNVNNVCYNKIKTVHKHHNPCFLVQTRQELIDRVLQLETHNQQLKNVLKKEIGTANGSSENNQKKFDFSK